MHSGPVGLYPTTRYVSTTMIHKIVSGGQTGVDRAALDVARDHDILHGGWCPKGRKAEDGTIPEFYMLSETPSSRYAQRTEWNVRDSDGTLVITRGEVLGGTRLTVDMARRYERPVFVWDLEGTAHVPDDVVRWIEGEGIHVLNVAGPRASEAEGIYADAVDALSRVLDTASDGP